MVELPALTIRRVLPFPRERVFRAWTDPKSVRQWFAPFALSVADAELDVRPGGHFRIMMRSEDNVYAHRGEYREVVPPERLVFTWISEATQGETTLVTVEFHERGAETELVLTHARLPDTAARERHEAGWVSIADRLAKHLAKPETGGEAVAKG